MWGRKGQILFLKMLAVSIYYEMEKEEKKFSLHKFGQLLDFRDKNVLKEKILKNENIFYNYNNGIFPI